MTLGLLTTIFIVISVLMIIAAMESDGALGALGWLIGLILWVCLIAPIIHGMAV